MGSCRYALGGWLLKPCPLLFKAKCLWLEGCSPLTHKTDVHFTLQARVSDCPQEPSSFPWGRAEWLLFGLFYVLALPVRFSLIFTLIYELVSVQ